MARIYQVTFEGVLISQPQDLVQINGASGKILRILRRWVGATDTPLPGSQMLQLRERFLPAIVTNGNGTSVTPAKRDPGDANASFAAFVNSTGKATTSATAVVLNEIGTHVYNGYDEPYLNPPPIGASEAYVWELMSTVNGTLHLSGGVEVEEIGG
jgi:hypothetical protein